MLLSGALAQGGSRRAARRCLRAARRAAQGPESGSLRSVMRLNPGQGERREQIGKAVDVVDSFTRSTGTMHRCKSVSTLFVFPFPASNFPATRLSEIYSAEPPCKGWLHCLCLVDPLVDICGVLPPCAFF